ncbi:MAG: hypothetical protein SWH68_14400 [Thermodesulfobacteriota bacterium]|nr:hypothetical protein [Thermodesulfobacteriota bacterium]
MTNATGKPENRFERHPFLTLLAVVLTAILLGTVVFVMIYYHRQKAALEHEGIMNAAFTYRIDSPVYHHDLAKKQIVKTATWGNRRYRLCTNSLGFRDASPRTVPLSTNKYRIVFMGDSFTEGIGLPYEKTFPGIVDQRLRKYNVSVLNAGVVSYSPIIYWRKTKYLLETVGLSFDEIVIFLDISDARDEAESYYLDDNGNVKSAIMDDRQLREKVINRIRKDQAVNSLKKFMGILAELLPPESGHPGTWTIDQQQFNKFGKKGLKQMAHYMNRLRVLLAEHDIKLTVAVYPWPVQIAAGDRKSIQAVYWRKWCADYGIDFLNYFPLFCPAKKPERKHIIETCFINGDTHWSYKGHQWVADVFCDYFHKTHQPDILPAPKAGADKSFP